MACCLSAANRRDVVGLFVPGGRGRRSGRAGRHNSGGFGGETQLSDHLILMMFNLLSLSRRESWSFLMFQKLLWKQKVCLFVCFFSFLRNINILQELFNLSLIGPSSPSSLKWCENNKRKRSDGRWTIGAKSSRCEER